MAQLAVSVAGAAIGFMVGGPVGAQVGWMAGSLIGAGAFGEKTQGPRLQDTKVQISSYGAAIPIPYGGVRLAGNVIWSTDLDEHASESGGKGGPSVTNYSYSVSCAVAIADRPIGGIRRIWADAKLVYDAREDATAEAQAASTMFAEYMTVYLGNETQLPDPTIEAAEGAGTVEAYRGVAYVVFTDLPLGDYGNRVPNFSFEITTEPATSPPLLEPRQILPWAYYNIDNDTGVVTPRPYPLHGHHDEPMEFIVLKPAGVAGTFSTMGAALAAAVARAAEPNSLYPGSDPYIAGTQFIGIATSSNSLASPFFGGATVLDDPRTVTYYFGVASLGELENIDNSPVFPVPEALYCPTSDLGVHIARYDFNGTFSGVRELRAGGGTDPLFPIRLNYCSNFPELPAIVSAPFTVIQGARLLTCRSVVCDVGNPCSAPSGLAQMPGHPLACISCTGSVEFNARFASSSGSYRVLLPGPVYSAGNLTLVRNAVGPVLASGDPNYLVEQWWRDQAAANGVDLTGLTWDSTFGVVVSGACIADGPQLVEAGSMLLADIVSDVCLRAGLQAGDIDVTQLIDVVQGYAITRQMSARAALEPLRQAFFFDAVENGEQIVFVKRGGASVATITADDLGATEGGESVALVVPKRAQETELPAEVNVAYMVRAADYQTGSQQARRVTTGSQQIVGAELPIVMTDAKAAEVSDVLMVDAWQGRVERTFSTTRKWTKYLPTDVVTVNDGEFIYRGRITAKNEDGPLIHWTLRDEAVATYSPSVTPSPTSGGGGEIRFVGPMAVELMDIPALRDVDDNAGFYAVAFSYIGSFRGGVLYKSVDDSAFDALQEMRVSAIVGHATTALADFDGGNVFDEANSVTVQIHSGGSLSSATTMQVLNGSNGALLGDEVLQFRTATLVAANTWTLTGLLRGRRGTEWAMAGHTHTDRFVLLNEATIYRVLQSLPQLGDAYYRPVAYGQSVADAGSVEFTNTGAALKPLSPVHLVATPTGGDIVVTWVRRTRIGGAWADGIEAPLSEVSESYRVRLLDALGDVIEQQTVSVQTATLTDTSEAYSVEVVQLSATVGAGFAATLII